jgi:hypothetical protein
LLLFCPPGVAAQSPDPDPHPEESVGVGAKVTNAVFDYLNMAGSHTAADFRPLNQRERNRSFGESFINPVWYFKGALSGALDLKNDKPPDWEQGASGYGKRFGNIMGQYAIQRTVTFGLSSLMHEDNRYFGSGKNGFWRRTGYAISSSFLARHDNGRQYISVSQLGGVAAGAFLSRTWQPPSSASAGDGAVSFGLTMAYHILGSELKEFLPQIVAPLLGERKPKRPKTP